MNKQTINNALCKRYSTKEGENVQLWQPLKDVAIVILCMCLIAAAVLVVGGGVHSVGMVEIQKENMEITYVEEYFGETFFMVSTPLHTVDEITMDRAQAKEWVEERYTRNEILIRGLTEIGLVVAWVIVIGAGVATIFYALTGLKMLLHMDIAHCKRKHDDEVDSDVDKMSMKV
ncbi:MAG: hypothetical protein KAJ03_11220 [Gammaproteobacteria bacterium]|nr:hypothetical protein [Gammaproteobacteria bacterium]